MLAWATSSVLSLSVPVFITDVFHASSADQNIVAAVRDGGD